MMHDDANDATAQLHILSLPLGQINQKQKHLINVQAWKNYSLAHTN